jgi:hypothetical protein
MHLQSDRLPLAALSFSWLILKYHRRESGYILYMDIKYLYTNRLIKKRSDDLLNRQLSTCFVDAVSQRFDRSIRDGILNLNKGSLIKGEGSELDYRGTDEFVCSSDTNPVGRASSDPSAEYAISSVNLAKMLVAELKLYSTGNHLWRQG